MTDRVDKLTWTSETPTEPGWYWARNKGSVSMYRKQVLEIVCWDDGVLVLMLDCGKRIPIADNLMWAGPIPVPEEPYMREGKWDVPIPMRETDDEST